MSKKKKINVSAESDFQLETVDITRSYSRKLNMGAHGGIQYETVDIFASRTAHGVPVDSELGISLELYKGCVADVESAASEIEEEGVQPGDEEEAPKRKKKAKKEVVEEEEDDEEEESEDEDSDDESEDDDEDESPKDKILNVSGFKMKRSEFEDASPYINDLNLSKTMKELKKAVARIQGDAAVFTDTQKKYLSALYKKRSAELSEDED